MRKGNDLIATQKISLAEALEAKSVELENINGSMVSVLVSEIIIPSTLLKIPNKGFYYRANLKNENQNRLDRGCMFVKFAIIFPKELSSHQKEQIKIILADN